MMIYIDDNGPHQAVWLPTLILWSGFLGIGAILICASMMLR